MQTIIRLCPPNFGSLSISQLLLLSSSLSPLLYHNCALLPVSFPPPVTLLLSHFLGTESEGMGRIEPLLGHLFCNPRHKRPHKP